MTDAHARRQRRYRQRRQQGRVVLRVAVPDVDLAAAMIDAGWLSAAAEDDRQALADAVEKLLAYLAAKA